MMSLAVIALFVGLVSATDFTAYTPATPTVDLERSHSAQISIDGDDVPDDTDRILIQAMEISDLTGNTWEEGYTFGYNSAVTTFYYPELNEASYHKFRVKYGNSDDDWTGYSSATSYSHAISTRYIVERIARNWAMAKEFCLQLGHRLAVISTSHENEQVEELMQEYGIETAWVGLFDTHYGDDNVNTTWTWVDGTPYKFSNFEKSASDVASTLNTSVVAVNEIGEWETHSPDEKMSFICEKGLSEVSSESESKLSMRESAIN